MNSLIKLLVWCLAALSWARTPHNLIAVFENLPRKRSRLSLKLQSRGSVASTVSAVHERHLYFLKEKNQSMLSVYKERTAGVVRR